jgi:hypothetical protein
MHKKFGRNTLLEEITRTLGIDGGDGNKMDVKLIE